MPFDNQGVFTRAKVFTQEVITFADHNTEDNDFSQAFNNTVCRDGSSTMTGDLKMGGKKITGMAEGTADTDAITKAQLDRLGNNLQSNIDNKFDLTKIRVVESLPENPDQDTFYFVIG